MTAHFGTAVEVPPDRPGAITLVRFTGIEDSLGATLQSTLFRGRPTFINAPGSLKWYRFTASHQEAWHVLRAPACLAPELEDTGPRYHRFVMSEQRGPSSDRTEFTAEFAYATVSCDRP